MLASWLLRPYMMSYFMTNIVCPVFADLLSVMFFNRLFPLVITP